MGQVQKILFVCSHNRQRSITGERLYQGLDQFEAKSAGTRPDARTPISAELLEWADLIFVMEPLHLDILRKQFKKILSGKRVICLHIPDKYGYMSLELVKLLKEKLGDYIAVPH
jgi:predicted protein tyrosine phosphatase